MADTASFADTQQDTASFAQADTASFAPTEQPKVEDTASFDDTTPEGDVAYVTGKKQVMPETMAGPDLGERTINTLRNGLPANIVRGIAGEIAKARRAVHGDAYNSTTAAFDAISTDYQQENPHGQDFFVKTAQNLIQTTGHAIERAAEDIQHPESGVAGEDLGTIATGIGSGIGTTASSAVQHPGDTIGSFITGLMADPEYALIGVPGASAVGTISGRILSAAGNTVKTGLVAGALGAGTSVVRQTAEKGFADPSITTNDALQLASLGMIFHGAKEGLGMATAIKANTNNTYNIKPPTADSYVPDSAFAENIDANLRAHFEDPANKQPVSLTKKMTTGSFPTKSLQSLGFSEEDAAALGAADMATDGRMNELQYNKWQAERDARADGSSSYQGLPTGADAVHDLMHIPDIVHAALSEVPKNPEIPLDDNTEAHTLEQEGDLAQLGVEVPGVKSIDAILKEGVNTPRTLKDFLTMPFEDFAKEWDGALQTLMLKHQRFISIMKARYTPEQLQIVERAGQLKDPSFLHPDEAHLYKIVQDHLHIYGEIGKKLGAFNEPIKDFWMRSFIPTDDAPQDVKDAWKDGNTGKLSASSRHFMSRVLPEGKEGLDMASELGLRPRYDNVADSLAAYVLQVNKAFVNRAAYKILFKMPGVLSDVGAVGYRLIPNHYLSKVRPYIPSEYQGLGKGKFINTNAAVYARSDVAPILDHLFDSNSISDLMGAFDMANWAAKRISLFSVFHAKTLSEHQILMNGGFMDAGEILRGTHPIFQQLLYGRAGDSIEAFVKNGGTIPSPEDVGADRFYQGVDSFKDATDALMQKIGIPKEANPIGRGLEAYEDVSKRFDRITWQRAMAGGKLLTFTNLFEKAKARNIDRVRNGKDKRLLSDRELAEPIALTVNDIFGGQNWLRMALDSRTELGRRIKLLATRPSSRVWAQRLIFAPDWTVSNMRAILKAPMIAGKMIGSKIAPDKIQMRPGEAQLMKYHAYFAARAGLVYFLAANTLNKLWAGHYIWDNKSWRTVELGDGRTMTLDKSLTEVADFLAAPWKTAAGKMSLPVKELIGQLGNESYTSPTASRPVRIVPKAVYDKADILHPKYLAEDIGYRLKHFGGNFVPIAAKNLFTGPNGEMQLPTKRSTENSVAGFFGFPIYEHSNPSDQWLRGLFDSATTQDPGY